MTCTTSVFLLILEFLTRGYIGIRRESTPRAHRRADVKIGQKKVIRLLADIQLLDQSTIPIHIDIREKIEERTPLSYQSQKSGPGVMILFKAAQMHGNMVDTLSQKRYLHFGHSGILFVFAILFDKFFLAYLG
jgi:hypothetical protein